MKKRLTQDFIDTVAPLPGRDLWVGDTLVPGLRLRVSPTGGRLLSFGYRSLDQKQRRIGYPKKSLEEARTLAKAAAADIAAGHDPQSDRDRRAKLPTLVEAFAQFDGEDLALKTKPTTRLEYNRTFRALTPDALKTKLIADVTRAEIAAVARGCTVSVGNSYLRLMSSFFGYLAGDGGLLPDGANPAGAIKKRTLAGRHFVFEGDQLFRLEQVLSQAKSWRPSVNAIRLLILTGMRRDEVLSLSWAEVKIDAKQIQLKDSKTGARPVPLSSAAIELLNEMKLFSDALRSPWVVPAPGDTSKHIINISKLWRGVRARADLDSVRIHDLRHNYAGMGAAVTKSAVHVQKMLGHTQISTSARYIELADEPLLEATNAVGEAISEKMRPANVVALRK